MDSSWKNKIDNMQNQKIDINKANAELEVMLDKYDWFYTSIVENNTICVYVSRMTPEVNVVPDILYGYRVSVGFAAYLTCGDKYSKRQLSDILNELEKTE